MSDDQEVIVLAGELRDALGRIMRRLRSELGFPLAQGSVLGRLTRDGAQSVGDLAAAEKVRHQSMAQTVRDLEAAGLVTRRPDPDDGRRAFVELTRAGREALLADRRHREGWLAEVLCGMTPDERTVLQDAVTLLRRAADS
jgi:DNA-binding MarR family transcriptional regulator